MESSRHLPWLKISEATEELGQYRSHTYTEPQGIANCSLTEYDAELGFTGWTGLGLSDQADEDQGKERGIAALVAVDMVQK